MPHPGIPPQPRTASAQWRPAVQVAIGKSARYSPFRRRLAGPRAYAADRRLAGRKLASSLLRENVFRSADSSTHCQQAGIARRSRAPGGPSGNPERFRLASAVTLSVLYETSTPRLRPRPTAAVHRSWPESRPSDRSGERLWEPYNPPAPRELRPRSGPAETSPGAPRPGPGWVPRPPRPPSGRGRADRLDAVAGG